MKLTRQKKVSIEKTLRAAEKAGDLLDAKLLLLEAKYNSKVEALQIGDEVDEEGICDAALRYLGERERLMREAKEMMALKKGKMKVVVAVILYLLQLVGVKRSDHYNTDFARLLSFLTGFSFNSIVNYLSEGVGIENECDLVEVNDILKGLGIKEMKLKNEK